MALALLGACTSMRTQPDWPESVRVGDHVRVWKRSSGIVDMTVTAVTADALEGTVPGSTEFQRIPASEIRQVERRQVDGVKVAKGIGIGIWGIVTALFVAFLVIMG